MLFICKPQVIQYLHVTEIAIKGSNIMTKLSNYVLPVTGLTSVCPQFTNWFRHFMVQNQSYNNHSRERKNINKKISFISLLLSRETLTIYHDILALRSKGWMYKHVYRLSGRPKFESLSTESISIGLPTRIQENVIFCPNWPPTLPVTQWLAAFWPILYLSLILKPCFYLTALPLWLPRYNFHLHTTDEYMVWDPTSHDLPTEELKSTISSDLIEPLLFSCSHYITYFVGPFLGFSLSLWWHGFKNSRPKI